MPSYKKRVHSQRIPQSERPAVTPYEGAYDEKYSSDEENVEYDVCEPEDLTERSNSTMTFSEDIYDSDVLDEMIKNQTRKPSQEGFLKSEGGQSPGEPGKPVKSILKDKGGSKKKGSLTTEEKPGPGRETVSPTEMTKPLAEEEEEEEAKPRTETDKKGEKGEKPLEDVTKPLQDITTDIITDKVKKGEREVVTKPQQSTIPQQTDQITDSAATNKHDNAKKEEESVKRVTKPPEETAQQPKQQPDNQIITKEKAITADKSPEEDSKVFLNGTAKQISDSKELPLKPIENVAKDELQLTKSLTESSKVISPTREEAAKTAMDLIDDITQKVQEVFPVSLDKTAKSDTLDDISENAFEIPSVTDKSPTAAKTEQDVTEKVTETTQKAFPQSETPTKDGTSMPEPKGKQSADKISETVLEIQKVVTEEMPSATAQIKDETTKQESALREIQKSVEKVPERLTAVGEKASETVDKAKSDLGTSTSTFANETTKLSEAFTSVKENLTKESEIVKETAQIGETQNEEIDRPTADSTKSEKFQNDVAEEISSIKKSAQDKITEVSTLTSKTADILSGITSGLTKTVQGTFSDITGESSTGEPNTVEGTTKPRVIFRIESEDDLASQAETELTFHPELSSPLEEFSDQMKKDLKATFESDQSKLEERLSSKSGIFDISDESLSKTKELVDERLRKISEIKPPKDLDEPDVKKEKPKSEEIKIGRFHITPALVEEVIARTKESEIADRLKTTRTDDDGDQDRIEKELPEKLTEADLEEVIRELKLEGLKTDVYLQPEEQEKEEKKERTLKRVERRFERMASETLEKEKEEADSVSEEKLDEKREVEFQRMISNLSNEEVAQYQQEYLYLWDEGGLSSLTPTDEWESRDPDTPENELEDDSPRKPESFRGSHGTGKPGEQTSALKSPVSPPKPSRISGDISPVVPIEPSRIDRSSGFVSDGPPDDIPTYGERKKFWEQMSSSQSSDAPSELPRSVTAESIETEKKPETSKSADEPGLVKSLTESYSKKIAAGELIMPAIPRPKSTVSRESSETEPEPDRQPDSSGTAMVSELEVKIKSRSGSVPITEDAAIPGNTRLQGEKVGFTIGTTVVEKSKQLEREESKDSEAEFLAKYGVESVAFDNTVFTEEDEDELLPLSERKKIFEPTPPDVPTRSERSMSLPVVEITNAVKAKKKYFEDEIKKEIIVEQIMTQEEKPRKPSEEKEKKLTPEIEETAATVTTELIDKGVKIAEETLRSQEKPSVVKDTTKIITTGVSIVQKISDKVPKTLNLRETHVEKNETEDNEKEKVAEAPKPKKKEESLPSITVTSSGKRQTETGSVGESEDTQSESDVTPEEARVVDNGDTPWDGSGTQSDDLDYPKEIVETGIGRWIGQEDLSKQAWDRDDLDSSHFKVPTKWERTRSEGASPKEHYVYTPEEHYPDTVWEVPVQEQLEKEEITHDIPIEKQVIIEKDEEEEYEEEDFEDEEKRVKLTEEEAKEIAEEILEYIQFEVENRSSFLINDDEEGSQGITQSQVTDYLRHLAGGKDFDDQDVRLIESVLVKKQRDQFRKSQIDTTASSIDITDEELRSSGVDNDISPVESQITKLQNLEEENFVQMSENEEIPTKEQTLRDADIVDQTIAEVKESLEAAQEQLIEQHKKRLKNGIFKKESPSEFEFKGITHERSLTESIREQSTDWEKITDSETTTETDEPTVEFKKTELREQILRQEEQNLETTTREKMSDEGKTEEKILDSTDHELLLMKLQEKEKTSQQTDKLKLHKEVCKDFLEREKRLIHGAQTTKTTETEDAITTDKMSLDKTELDKTTKKTEESVEKLETGDAKSEQFQSKTEDRQIQQITEKRTEEKESFKDSLLESEKTVTETVQDSVVTRKTEISKAQISTKTDNEKLKALEIGIPQGFAVRKVGEQFYSSDDSPRSTSLEESTKSPAGEEVLSSASSVDKPGDFKSDKSDIVFRHSSSSTLLKADRRSGTDLEPYSSSGESHYHSFEQTSSRPCSSDVEVLLAGNVGTTGSSEYESAISQEASSKQATDYHTAVSSLSSRESIKSLDSESSGHLASVEVSSEASETLIPSALELDKDIEAPGSVLLEDDTDLGRSKKSGRTPQYQTQMSSPAATGKRSVDEDFEVISESEVASWAGEVSEDEDGVQVAGEEEVPSEEHAQKMKRSYEMTFQPEPKPIAFSDSLDGFSRENLTEKAALEETLSIVSAPDERFGSSLEESGSVLSMSLSTTSELSGARTVIELSRTDSDKMDGSLTISATSHEDLDNEGTPVHQPQTNEMSTSTVIPSMDKKTASVTITTSSSDEHGVPSVSTQVTSVSRKSSMADEAKSESESTVLSHANGPTQVDYVADYDEVETTKTKKTQGHRRKESTSNFVPTMMWNVSEARTQKLRADITELDEESRSDKYVYDVTLTEKEVKNDEKKEADDSESYDPALEVYAHDRKISEGEEVEEFKDYDSNRPQSQISTDSGRRPVSSVFSEDVPDSELSDLMKQGSSETERDDPLERPPSPEPEEMENKDITPEFSSEAQASVTELEMEYSGAYSRRDEYASHVSPIREERSEIPFRETTSEENESGLRSQTSLESTIAEKHELETGEKEILQKKDATSGEIPDITVTEHMTPVLNQKFQYPDQEKEKKPAEKTPDTPASTSSRTSSSSTDQGKEYNLDEVEIKKIPKEILSEEKETNETKEDKESLDSPSSDSFEMLDKPDITDEFVIIEEVGREAQENDQEGKSIQITSRKKKPPKRKPEDQEVIISPPSPATKMTDLKYFPEDPDLFSFDQEGPPQPTTRKFVEKLVRKSSKEEKDEQEFDQQIEQSKKWVEMQFQGEQAAKIIGGYGYEMEFERAPLEDIKEEDLNELESSSKIGSMGSQKESLGSFGSVKDSFSSTPDYDVLAGKKYFTRSGDHDDVSMSSLQEFELIEKKLMENGKKSGSSSSQDSLSSKKLGTSSKSGQGDDISQASLREFETLENACATVVKMETKAKQEEAILSEIDEGHESQISESESCETVSAVMREKIESDTEDFDKRMFEIDEIIRQAQSNVEKFSEMQALEKIESMGRGDSYEEVAKVPDLELDMPLSGRSQNPKGESKTTYSTQVVTKKTVQQWRESEKVSGVPPDPQPKTKLPTEQKSDLLGNGGKIKSISADSLEIQAKEKLLLLEGKDDTISLDSFKRKSQKSDPFETLHKSDSMEEVSRHHETSSGDYSSSGTDPPLRPPPRSDYMLGSTDSLDPSSSTATHATYQYETDSVMSSSFTSGDSNTMVSSTDNLDLLVSGQSVIDLSKDLGISKTDDWLENLEVGGEDPLVRELIDRTSGHQLPPEVQKVVFRGPDAKNQLEEYLDRLGPEEEIVETEEVDEHGNVHLKKVLKQKIVIRGDQTTKVKPTEVHREKVDLGSSQAFSSETVEPLQHDQFSHIVHKKTQMVPEVEKVVFKGPDAEKSLKEYLEKLNTAEEVEEQTEVDEDGNVHVKRIIRQRVAVRPGETSEVQKISFKGEHSEEALREYIQSLNTEDEIVETEELDADGNIHVKKILRKKLVVKPEDLTAEELAGYIKQTEITGSGPGLGPHVQKITIRGSNAEKALDEYIKNLNPQDDVVEVEEVDEHGNVHIKKVLRQRIVVRPNRELTKDELTRYLSQLEESGRLEGEGYSHVVESRVEMPSDVQKITFKGPDAERQLEEYLKNQKSEVEEIEEVDEHGNVHIKKVLRQRVVVRPSRGLTKAELEEYLNQLEEPDTVESEIYTRGAQSRTTDVQKISFKGPDAEKQLEEYLKSQQPEEVEEIEEVDEHGNIHIKRVLRQRVVVKPSRELTKAELEEYLNQLEEPDTVEGETYSRVMSSGVGIPTDVQKITFKGPDAEKQLEEYLKSQQPEEVEEIEEVDEHGNIHIKKVLRQRVVVKPSRELTKAELEEYLNQLEEPDTVEGETYSHVVRSRVEMPADVQKITFKGPDAEKQLQEFLKTQQPEQVEEIEEVDEHGNVHIKRVIQQRVFIRPEDLQKSGYSRPEIQKLTASGHDAEKALKDYLETLGPDHEIAEIEEVDEHGNIHHKKVLRQRVIIRPEELGDRELTKEELQDYLRRRSQETTLHYETVDIGTTQPFVSEIIEPLDDREFSHIIHRKIDMAPEVQKVTFRGPDADKALQTYIEAFDPGADLEETEEIDEDGNVHVKRVLRRKIVLKPEDLEKTGLSGEDLKAYLKNFEFETFEGESRSHPTTSANQSLTEAFSSSFKLTEKDGTQSERERIDSESSSAIKKESGISQRPPLVSDISMDDEAEFDPTEHDWRHQLEILHAEADEDEIDQNLDAAIAASSFQQKKQ